jgi:hypothetical protein
MGIEKIVGLDLLRDVSIDGNLLRWVKHFDTNFYRKHGHYNGFADLCGLDDSELILHFITTGHLERRSYNGVFHSFIDPVFYRKQYPELDLSDDSDAIRHWMYFGVYEKRAPNEPTQQLIDATIHLFQMGRVGSKSIESALYAAGHANLVPHLHWPNELMYSYPDSFYSYDEIVNLQPDRKKIFVSGVRDPVDRVISGLFNSISESRSTMSERLLFDLLERPQLEIDFFFEKHVDPIVNWFGHDYFSGLDVYEQPFDKEAGYSIIRKGGKTVFIYRFDRLPHIWPILCDVVGMDLPATHINQSERAGASPRIAEFRARLRLGDDLSQRIASSRYVQHFFV